MEWIRGKIKRVGPLIRAKQALLDQEAAVLAKIRQEKSEAVRIMQESQRTYLEGVEQLNRARESPNRPMLGTLERSLDYVKDKWYSFYREVQKMEQRENSQIHQVLQAQQNLRSFEKLKERYEKSFADELRSTDQKNIDEAALRKFTGPRS